MIIMNFLYVKFASCLKCCFTVNLFVKIRRIQIFLPFSLTLKESGMTVFLLIALVFVKRTFAICYMNANVWCVNSQTSLRNIQPKKGRRLHFYVMRNGLWTEPHLKVCTSFSFIYRQLPDRGQITRQELLDVNISGIKKNNCHLKTRPVFHSHLSRVNRASESNHCSCHERLNHYYLASVSLRHWYFHKAACGIDAAATGGSPLRKHDALRANVLLLPDTPHKDRECLFGRLSRNVVIKQTQIVGEHVHIMWDASFSSQHICTTGSFHEDFFFFSAVVGWLLF